MIDNLDWDIIELKATFDPAKMHSYYMHLKDNLSHLEFSFTSQQYLRQDIYEQYKNYGSVGNYLGNISGWSISWPVDRDIPCPSKSQANQDMYPEIRELDEKEFYEQSKPMEHYKFGVLNEIIDTFGPRALRQMLMAVHPPGLMVNTHTDGLVRKLHIPFYTNPDAVFVFGENRERVYPMEVGKAYIINTLVPHGTENLGDTERVHLLSRIDLDYVPRMLSITNKI